MFDNGVLIDYHSTDRSVEICREIAPHWEVVTSRNSFFSAAECDQEVMEIESRFADCWKMVLNTTEFLCTPDFQYFLRELEKSKEKAFSIRGTVVVDPPNVYPSEYPLLDQPLALQRYFGYFEDEHPRPGRLLERSRFLHSHTHGAYDIGRHRMGHPCYKHPDGALVLWFGFSPWNDQTIARKLQIQSKIPDSDKKKGLGVQHLVDTSGLEILYHQEVEKSEDLRLRREYQLAFSSPEELRSHKVLVEPLVDTSKCVIPFVSSLSAQTYAWQRYLFFRPWYANAKVVELGFGEGYGLDYVSTFAASAVGYEADSHLVEHAQRKYRGAQFNLVPEHHSSIFENSDLVLCIDVLHQADAPEKILKELADANVDVIISIPSRNACDEAKVQIKHQWSLSTFRNLVGCYFPDRKIQFLSQEKTWPGLLKASFDPEAESYMAVISNKDLPQWPRIGISIPTARGSTDLDESVLSLSGGYPGETHFAVVANGCAQQDLDSMQKLKKAVGDRLTVLELSENKGYGQGTNIGFDYLMQHADATYYVVSNDDIIACTDCLPILVEAMHYLESNNLHPGVVAPVSNEVQGVQRVHIGDFRNVEELFDSARHWHKQHHQDVAQAMQLRGLFLLISSECMKQVGGFDPVFGLGNFEDDDHNVRTRLAGMSLWLAQGAFLYHKGSQTFKRLGVNYTESIEKNRRIFCKKWDVTRLEDAFLLREVPHQIEIFLPYLKNVS